MAGSYRLSFKI